MSAELREDHRKFKEAVSHLSEGAQNIINTYSELMRGMVRTNPFAYTAFVLVTIDLQTGDLVPAEMSPEEPA